LFCSCGCELGPAGDRFVFVEPTPVKFASSVEALKNLFFPLCKSKENHNEDKNILCTALQAEFYEDNTGVCSFS
jgi:hypothetical protein